MGRATRRRYPDLVPRVVAEGRLGAYTRHAAYTGRYQTFVECGGTGTVYVTVAAVPPDNAFTAIVVMQLVSEADLAVLDQVFATFIVTS